MDSLIHDFSGALRHLRWNLRFVVIAVLILGLGIGATTAVFSASEALLLRPLPYPDGDRLVTLRSISPDPSFPYGRAAADESCDFAVVTALRSAGHDVAAIVELSPGAEDDVVLVRARAEARVLLTEDKDFGQLAFGAGRDTPGIVLIRFPAGVTRHLTNSSGTLTSARP